MGQRVNPEVYYMTDSRLATVKEVADLTGIPVSTLVKARLYRPEDSPPYIRMGRRVW